MLHYTDIACLVIFLYGTHFVLRIQRRVITVSYSGQY